MGLPVPKEPKDVKEFIKEVRERLGGENNVKNDTIAVWSFNRLPKYLWSQWSGELKRRGITWQEFLKILKLKTDDAIKWALRDALTWSQFVKSIEESITHYSTTNRSSREV